MPDKRASAKAEKGGPKNAACRAAARPYHPILSLCSLVLKSATRSSRLGPASKTCMLVVLAAGCWSVLHTLLLSA